MTEGGWEARMAARARGRRPAPVPQQTAGPCAHCGHQEHTPDGRLVKLRYWNSATLANYCSDECLRHDPGWDDNSIWMA